MGVYYANLSVVQFRSMKLGIHVYVYFDIIRLTPYYEGTSMKLVILQFSLRLIYLPLDGYIFS